MWLPNPWTMAPQCRWICLDNSYPGVVQALDGLSAERGMCLLIFVFLKDGHVA